jgi:hypothetical protein
MCLRDAVEDVLTSTRGDVAAAQDRTGAVAWESNDEVVLDAILPIN